MNDTRNETEFARNRSRNDLFLKDPNAQKNNNITTMTQNNGAGPAQQYFIPVDYETFSKWQQQVAEGMIYRKYS